MRNRYPGLTIVLCVVFCLIVAQSFFAQAPAPGGPGGGAAPGAPVAPGGGRGGAAGGGAQGGRGGGGGAGGRGGGGGGAPAGPVVKAANGKPELTGYWGSTLRTNIEGATSITEPAGGKIPYNEVWLAKAADTAKNHMFDEPYAHCLPGGVPTNFGLQFGFQIVQDPTSIVFAWDTGGATRVIYTDNRKHVPSSVKLYQGDSIGHWETGKAADGSDIDVLVVDTTSQAYGWLDVGGHVHSDAIHVVERFTPTNANTIAYEAVLEDPIAFTQPMKVVNTFTRNLNVPAGFRARPTGYEQTETACVEGDKDMALYTVSAGGLAPDAPPSSEGVLPTPAGGAPAGGGRGGGGAPAGGGRGGGGGAPGGGGRGGAPPAAPPPAQ